MLLDSNTSVVAENKAGWMSSPKWQPCVWFSRPLDNKDKHGHILDGIRTASVQ